MKVLVLGKGVPFVLLLPSRLLFSRGTAKLFRHISSSAENVPLTQEQIGLLFQTLRECRKNFPRLVLANVKTADGQRIKVML